jgi:hypothetical protein
MDSRAAHENDGLAAVEWRRPTAIVLPMERFHRGAAPHMEWSTLLRLSIGPRAAREDDGQSSAA